MELAPRDELAEPFRLAAALAVFSRYQSERLSDTQVGKYREQ